MSKWKRLLSLIPAVLGLILMAGAMTVFTACGPREDGTWMNCHNAQTAAAACGALLAALFAAAAFLENRAAVITCYTSALVLSIVTFLIPGILVHTCALGIMRCNSVLKPFVRIIASVETLHGLWFVVHAAKRNKGQ